MNDIIALTLTYRDAAFRVALNDFPIFSTDTVDSGFVSLPLNAETVAGSNALRIDVDRRGADGAVSLRIDVQAAGTFIDSGADPQLELPADPTPFTFEHRFDSDSDHLGVLLREAQPATADDVVAYALALRDAFRSSDTDGLLTHFAPKLAGVAAAFGHPPGMLRAQFSGMLQTFAKAGIDYDADDIDPIPLCEQRLWRLERRGGGALFRIEEDGGSMSLDLVAAQLPTGFAIVK